MYRRSTALYGSFYLGEYKRRKQIIEVNRSMAGDVARVGETTVCDGLYYYRLLSILYWPVGWLASWPAGKELTD